MAILLIDLQKENEEKKWTKAIQSYPYCFEYIKDPTLKMCELAVKLYSNNFKHVPIKFLSQSLCDMAVKSLPENFEFVPESFWNLELIICAIKGDRSNLRFLKEIPLNVFQIAQSYDSSPASTIRFIENPTEEIQIASVRLDPLSLKWIKNPTENTILAAIKRNGDLLISVPKEKQTLEICSEALKTSLAAYKSIKLFDNIHFKSHSEALDFIKSQIEKNALKNKINTL